MRPRWSAVPSLIALALAAAFVSPVHAQGFHAVHTSNGVDVWAVGDAGLIYRSFDGGSNWHPYTLGAQTLRGVAVRGLNAVVVSDSGKIWRTTDSGGNWALTVISGAPDIHAVEMPSDLVGYAVGNAGTIVKTTNGGVTWAAQTSGTSAGLRGARFTDELNGWVVGLGGTVLKTVNGGANWTPVSVGTSESLLAVDLRASTIWVVGDNGTAVKSVTGGASWAPVNLKFDTRSDVRSVWVQSPDSVYLVGGGGFIRLTGDGGKTWWFERHSIQSPMADIFFRGVNGWAVNSKGRVILYSIDGGNFWRIPTTGSVGRVWIQKQAFGGQTRGNTFAMNGQSRTIYCGLGSQVVQSLDQGETWTVVASFPAGVNRVNSFLVSPKDSMLMLAAVKGTAGAQVLRSTVGGASWTPTLSGLSYGEYGVPLEMHPDLTDTIYFGVEDTSGVMASGDFGATWTFKPSNQHFRSPCDLVVVPDSSNIMIVGDGVTGSGNGQYFKSTDGGETFALMATRPGSEIPGLAGSRLRNGTLFGTNWSTGGAQRSTDYGSTWPNVSSISSAWGVDICDEDPNVVILGQFSGPNSHLSLDGGASSTFTNVQTLSGNNYAFYVPDRSVILAAQSSGIYKMSITQGYSAVSSQVVNVTFPNGGEVWQPGSAHTILWTSLNLPLARVEYSRGPGEPWQLIATVPGYQNNLGWTVPFDATSHARIRVRDAWDYAPDDSSDGTFTIPLAAIQVTPATLDFGARSIGTSTTLPITIHNIGTAPLSVTSIETGGGVLAKTGSLLAGSAYVPGRTSLTLAAGQSDTVGITFSPTDILSYPDSVVVTSNAYGAPTSRVTLTGRGRDSIYVDLLAPAGGETWRYGTVHGITWDSGLMANVRIEYQTSPGPFTTIVPSVPATPASYAWTIPFNPSPTARVVIRQVGGPRADTSAVFEITSPLFEATPDPLELSTPGNTTVTDAITIENAGTAPLTISSVTVDDPEFWAGRSSFTIPAGESDTLGISFSPTALGPDTALVTIVADDPFAPHQIDVHGNAPGYLGTDDQPLAFGLWQNQPNPFQGATRIRYALPVAARVHLEVFNLHGQRVATLVNGEQGAGQYTVSFGRGAGTTSGSRMASPPAGVYFYRFDAGSFHATRKMLILK